MLAYLRDHMARSTSRLAPLYGLRASEVEIDTRGSSEYPVMTPFDTSTGRTRPVRRRSSGPSMWSGATERAVRSGRRSVVRWWGRRDETNPGGRRTLWRSVTFRTSPRQVRRYPRRTDGNILHSSRASVGFLVLGSTSSWTKSAEQGDAREPAGDSGGGAPKVAIGYDRGTPRLRSRTSAGLVGLPDRPASVRQVRRTPP